MAQSVEEISRASVEKQYLAQHVYDLVSIAVSFFDPTACLRKPHLNRTVVLGRPVHP